MLIINELEAALITKKEIIIEKDAKLATQNLCQKIQALIWLYIHIDDLGIVFNDGHQTLYRDFCNEINKHLNRVGTSIVAAMAYGNIKLTETMDLAFQAAITTSRTQNNTSDEIRKIIHQ